MPKKPINPEEEQQPSYGISPEIVLKLLNISLWKDEKIMAQEELIKQMRAENG